MRYDLDDVLRRFDVQGDPTSWRGLLKYVVHCPNAARHKHGDRTPSAALFVDLEHGTIGYRCFAGCTKQEAFAAVGLPPDLRLETQRNGAITAPPHGAKLKNATQNGKKYFAKKDKKDFAKFLRVASYELKNRAGELIAIQDREEAEEDTHTAGAKKSVKRFRYRLPSGEYGLSGLSPSDLPLYGAHLIADGVRVAIHEGAKCAEAHRRYLETIGATDEVPVAYIGGANALPSDAVLMELSGVAEIVLYPDHDAPGHAAALQIGERLHALYPDTPLYVWQWSKAPDGGDFADWFELFSGDTPDETLEDAFVPFEEYAAAQRGARWRERFAGALYITAAELEGAEFPPFEYLPFFGLPGYIARGYCIVFAGWAKTGKTESVFSNLRDWIERGERVLYLSEEAPVILHNRSKTYGLAAAEARGGGRVQFLCPPFDATREEVVQYILDHPTCTVVVIDSLRSIARLTDETDNTKTEAELRPLIDAATRTNHQTLLLVHHMSKSGGTDGRGIAGAHAIVAAADGYLELHKDPRHETRRVVRGVSRLYTVEEFAFERTGDGQFVALGKRDEVERVELRRSVLAALAALDGYSTRQQVHDALDDRDSINAKQLRAALDWLTARGYAQRTPSEEHKGATYRWQITDTGRQWLEDTTTEGQR
jgi:KaiC/GvpD/RAD55 family RecA-like ATPase